MSSLRRRVVVVVAFGLVAFVVAFAWRARTGPARYAKARERANAACRAYRSAPVHANANVCRGFDEYGPRATEIYRRVNGTLAEAEASFARGDRRAAESTIAHALSSLDDLTRMGTPIADMVSATIVDRVLDLLAVHPELDRASILRSVHLDGARRPLETARLQHLWDLAHWNESFMEMPMPGEAALADEMEADEAAFDEMERALLGGDVHGCERAAQTGGSRMRASGLMPLYCEKLTPVVRAAKRLDEARASR